MITLLKGEWLFLFLIFLIFWLLKYFRIISHYKFHLNLIKWKDSKTKHKSCFYHVCFFLCKTCLVLGVSSLIISITEPCVYKTKKGYSEKGNSLMFLLDVSPSMAVKDIDGMSRLSACKKIIKDFVSSYQGDSFGLSVFAENASILLVPTIDISTFLLRLEKIEIGDEGEGTAIENALALLIANINSTSNNSCIILLTDGENNNKSIIDTSIIVEILKKRGIKLYIVKLGKSGYAPVEYFDKVKKKNYSGTYYTKANDEQIKNIAKHSNGEYVNIQTIQDEKEIFNIIKKQTYKANNYFIQTEEWNISFYFILLSFVLVIASWIISRIIIGLI